MKKRIWLVLAMALATVFGVAVAFAAGDWGASTGIPVTVTPMGSEGAVMKFKVEVGEGAEKGFLRVAP